MQRLADRLALLPSQWRDEKWRLLNKPLSVPHFPFPAAKQLLGRIKFLFLGRFNYHVFTRIINLTMVELPYRKLLPNCLNQLSTCILYPIDPFQGLQETLDWELITLRGVRRKDTVERLPTNCPSGNCFGQ